MSRQLLVSRTIAVLLLGLWAAAPAAAQSFTWNDPTTGNWSIGTNWGGGTAPASGSGTELVFNGTGTTYTASNDIADPFLLNRLTLNHNGFGGISINSVGAAPLVFTGAGPQLVNTGNGFATVGAPLTLGANTLFTGTGTGIVTLAGPVTDGGGGFGLTVDGAGTFEFAFAGVNSVNFLRLASGTTRVAGGSWSVASAGTDAAAGAFVAGTIAGQTTNFTLLGGAVLTTPGGNVLFGGVAGATATGTITGAGTTVTATTGMANTGRFVVGESGMAEVTIDGGAVVSSTLGAVGRLAGSNGTAVVDGAGSLWSVSGTLAVGPLGTGSLTVQNSGQVSAGTLSIGQASNSHVLVIEGGSVLAGNVSVGGGISSVHPLLIVGNAGAQLITTGQLEVIGGGQLFVSTGGLVQVGTNLFIEMTSSGANAHVIGGTLTVQGGLFMAQQTTAELVIENGGQVTVAGNMFLATSAGTGGRIDVLQNARLTLPGPGTFLVIGGGNGAGQGDLFVSAGGVVDHTGPQITLGQDASSIGRAFVFNGASITTSGTLVVGLAGTGRVDMQNGGTITAGNVVVASVPNSSGTVSVNGAGTTLLSNGVLRLGGTSTTPGGTATFTVEAGATAAAVGLATLFGGATVNVNAASLSVGGLSFGTPTSFGNINLLNGGTLTVTTGLGAVFPGFLTGAGSFTKAGPGTQTLAGVNLITGNTNIDGGTLALIGNGSFLSSPIITVAPGAELNASGRFSVLTLLSGQALRGGGTVTGGLTAESGSTIAPGTLAGSDDLVFNGNLTLEPGSTLATRIGVGAAGVVHDQVVIQSGVVTVTGSTLSLSGTFVPTPDFVMTVLLNTANSPVVGTFANPAVPGDALGRLDFGQYYASISYFGSNGMISGGNDVVLHNILPVPEPGAVLGASALFGLVAIGRRRVRRRLIMRDYFSSHVFPTLPTRIIL